MAPTPGRRGKLPGVWRGMIEAAFIIFLFYANLLMGEFERSDGPGKSWAFALRDILTTKNFMIAVIAALVGYGLFESLRRRL